METIGKWVGRNQEDWFLKRSAVLDQEVEDHVHSSAWDLDAG